MAKKKLSLTKKFKSSDWEIVDDLPKAQDGLNTPIKKFGNSGELDVVKKEIEWAEKQRELENFKGLYEPGQNVKNLKAVISGLQFSPNPLINLGARIEGTVADATTAALYALSGQPGKASIDAGQALLNWVPGAKGEKLAKTSDLVTIGEAFNWEHRPSIEQPKQELAPIDNTRIVKKPFKNGENINSQWEIMEEGGDVITDPQGQWKYPGKITRIPGNNMATHGYGNIPLYVVPDVGKPEIVYPNTGNHKFPKANSFTEYPLMKKGGSLLNKTINCSNCGHSWKSADGGSDPFTCHNCGNIVQMKNGGEMIKRADGTYSKRGLWDNVRANAGSGKKPTKEMLKQEKKIKAAEKKENGGSVWEILPDNEWEIVEEFQKGGLIKAQNGITVDDNIQKFNELQRQISDIRNIRSKAVDKAKEVVKSNKYYELPKSALNFEQTQGKQEETCINGVCGVYNDIGVKFDQPGTVEGRFIGNGTFRNTNPKTGNPNYYDAGFRPIYNRDEMQVGDLVAWGKGHMQIMTDKDADGFKSFDNYNKAERAYKWGELSNPVVYGKNKTYREPLGFRYSKNENELQQQRDSLKKEIQKDNPHFLDNTFIPKYGDYKQLNTVNYTPTEGNTLSIKKSNAEKWLGSILPDQKKYMQDYNLSQSEFEKIAKLYSGILEQESDLGTSPRYFAKKIPLMQLFGKELTDVKDIYKGKKPTYSLSDMIFNENYSQGVGQIKPKWFKEDNKYGINVDDPRAAFITLLDRYKNQVHENKGTEEGYRQLVNAYKGIKSPNNEYLQNVFDYANKVNFNSDLVAPKFDYEGSKKKNQMPIRRGQYVESPTMRTGGEVSKWEIIN